MIYWVQFPYTFLTGTSLLFSFAEAGKFDEVDVIPLNSTSHCTKCVPCPVHGKIGDCGEDFVVQTLLNKRIPTYLAQYDTIHGLDIVAFTTIGRNNIPLVILHEAKMSSSSTNVSASNFKGRLGHPKSGEQCSRSWLNSTINHMHESKLPKVNKLALDIDYVLNKGGYFVRTGNLRVETNQRSYLQFYAMIDKLAQEKDIEEETVFTSGPFLQRWANQYGAGFRPTYRELPLTYATINYLYSLFS